MGDRRLLASSATSATATATATATPAAAGTARAVPATTPAAAGTARAPFVARPGPGPSATPTPSGAPVARRAPGLPATGTTTATTTTVGGSPGASAGVADRAPSAPGVVERGAGGVDPRLVVAAHGPVGRGVPLAADQVSPSPLLASLAPFDQPMAGKRVGAASEGAAGGGSCGRSSSPT